MVAWRPDSFTVVFCFAQHVKFFEFAANIKIKELLVEIWISSFSWKIGRIWQKWIHIFLWQQQAGDPLQAGLGLSISFLFRPGMLYSFPCPQQSSLPSVQYSTSFPYVLQNFTVFSIKSFKPLVKFTGSLELFFLLQIALLKL